MSVVALASVMPSDDAAAKSKGDNGKGEGVVSTRPHGTPVMAIVSLNQQRVTVYDAEGPMLTSPVSSGQTGYDTPAGIYTVLERNLEHFSNLYDDASMPFMQRITWSGIALHAGVLPGYPASHGCIRLPMGFAQSLFERTKLGMRVIVVRDDVSPVRFSHPVLFKPLPAEIAPAPGTAGEGPVTKVADAAAGAGAGSPPRPRMSVKAAFAAKTEAAAQLAKKAEDMRLAARSATLEAGRASKALRRAEAAKKQAEWQLRQAQQSAGAMSDRAQKAKAAAQQALAAAETQLGQIKAEVQPKIDLAAKLRDEAKAAGEASATAQEELKAAARKLTPVSVFISRANQRLYVRQAREPVFDTAITIANADRPLGTYVFTALAYTEGEADVRWSLVSMYGPKAGPGTAAARKRDRGAGPVAADHAGAKAALDRIAIPKEAQERISELVSPGASLIVSDESLSRETGAATEFIVLMSGEPQGGIKIRRRPGEPSTRFQRPPSFRSPYGGGWSSPSPFSFW
jgi:L,D-transpeptidase-like protein